MSGAGRWSDLSPRIGSAVVLVGLGFGAIWAGNVVFALFLALICAGMSWELLRMLSPRAPERAVALAALVGAALLLSFGRAPLVGAPVLAVPVLLAAIRAAGQRRIAVGYMVLILVAGVSLMALRAGHGMAPVLWLILVVVATDVAGYFAGKALGGPKFWPRISPKKTWSGTVAGWIAAAAIGLIAARLHGGGAMWPVLAVAISMAAQAGDVAESAIKRRAGVKDSSWLIPGHGGLMDRFDGMLGAAALLMALQLANWIAGGLI